MESAPRPERSRRTRSRQRLRSHRGGAMTTPEPYELFAVKYAHHGERYANLNLFPRANFHIQDKEMAYATGRHMAHRPFGEAYAVEDVVGLVREVYKGRVRFHDGDAALAPGLSVHHVGGHTMGLQVVRVWTRRGRGVLASHPTHLYSNFLDVPPFPILFH